jgi:hypothetical protein
MKLHRRLKIISQCNTPAIGGMAERWGAVVYAAAWSFEIYAFTVLFMSQHQGSRDEWMRLRKIFFGPVAIPESYSITLAAKCASVTGHGFFILILGHQDIQNSDIPAGMFYCCITETGCITGYWSFIITDFFQHCILPHSVYESEGSHQYEHYPVYPDGE